MGKIAEMVDKVRAECLRVYGEGGFFTFSVEHKHLSLKEGAPPRVVVELRIFESANVGMVQKFCSGSLANALELGVAFLESQKPVSADPAIAAEELEELGGEG